VNWLDWGSQFLLLGLLIATLVRSLRLERALAAFRQDRAAMQEAAAGLGLSVREAEGGIGGLRAAADGAGRELGRQLRQAGTLREDIAFLVNRGEAVADRLDTLVRSGQGLPDASAGLGVRSDAERDLLRALREARA
jgi:hypothetical protein